MSKFKRYKPLESEYNIEIAVENLRMAYWSNEPEKVAKNFTKAEDIIISAICHGGYTLCKETTLKAYRENEKAEIYQSLEKAGY